MNRDTRILANEAFDLIVIGGGIYGAWIAWDASLRGLKTALVEKADFGGATSSNSLRIVHGGLRYLQHADIRRARESIMERMTLMAVAPHLVHPLPFLIPTYRDLTRSRVFFAAALLMNEIVGLGKNRLGDPQKYLPRGAVVSRDECLELFGDLDRKGLTGGAVFYDCQLHNSERLLVSILRSAANAGATVANHLEVEGFLKEGGRVAGACVIDRLTGERFDIRARFTINTTGPWVNRLLGLLGPDKPAKEGFRLSGAFNVLTREFAGGSHALGVWSKREFHDSDAVVDKGSRMLFVTPWQGRSFTGTAHFNLAGGDPDSFRPSDEEVADFIEEVNSAYPGAGLDEDDVERVYYGLLPGARHCENGNGVIFRKDPIIIDHLEADGTEGIISLAGIKFTEARLVGQRVVDRALRRMGEPHRPSATSTTAVHGGEIDSFNVFLEERLRRHTAGFDDETVRALVYNHGSAFGDVAGMVEEDPALGTAVTGTTTVTRAEILHAVRREMAMKLTDLAFRRTDLGLDFAGLDSWADASAELMAGVLGWDKSRTAKEVDEVKSLFKRKTMA